MTPVAAFDALAPEEALRQLLNCCGARRWAAAMAAGRPYGSYPALLAAAEQQLAGLTTADWLEAFAQHPRIGDLASLTARFAATAHFAAGEQGQVRAADAATLAALAAANAAYERQFGFTFIVCATGKSAAQMLAILTGRSANPQATELQIAADEQKQITRLRLATLGAAPAAATQAPREAGS